MKNLVVIFAFVTIFGTVGIWFLKSQEDTSVQQAMSQLKEASLKESSPAEIFWQKSSLADYKVTTVKEGEQEPVLYFEKGTPLITGDPEDPNKNTYFITDKDWVYVVKPIEKTFRKFSTKEEPTRSTSELPTFLEQFFDFARAKEITWREIGLDEYITEKPWTINDGEGNEYKFQVKFKVDKEGFARIVSMKVEGGEWAEINFLYTKVQNLAEIKKIKPEFKEVQSSLLSNVKT